MLDRLAAATPAPGGGSAAALTCALAAALVEMAAGFAPGEAGAADTAGRPGARARAAALRARALELAQADESSYGPVLEALALPRAQPGRREAVAAALSAAADVPFDLVGVAAEVCALADGVAGAVGRHTVGDAAVAAVLAQAACRAAALLVELNLEAAEDDRPGRAAQLVGATGEVCSRALSKAHES